MENEADLAECEEQELETMYNNIMEKDKCSNHKFVKEDTNIHHNKITKLEKSLTITFILVCIIGVSLGILLEIFNSINQVQKARPKYWIHPDTTKHHSKNMTLKHVHVILERLGYVKTTNETPWNLLWSHPTPFGSLDLRNISSNQKVNHFPGTGHFTSKVVLATSNLTNIPKAFRLPKDKEKFLKYAAENKDKIFVQKNNTHRNVRIKNVSDIDLTNEKTFVQEYIQKPFLVDGHKFDLGVYVVLKSVNPLRVYWYKGDVMFRYCPEKYYPFDPNNVDKYVVGDQFMPTWEVPSLRHSFTTQGYSMKGSFDIYLRSKGIDPADIWEDALMAIAEVFYKKEQLLIDAVKKYKSPDSFFELIRFDLILDEDLNVYLLEANMGPNLNSPRLPNQLMYEQVLYNLFSLVGVAQAHVKAVDDGDVQAAKDMLSAQKNIAVFGNQCKTTCMERCDALDLCGLCKLCISERLEKILITTHTETLQKGDFRRLIPPPMIPNKDLKSVMEDFKNFSENNKLLHLWYQGKCNEDVTWCI